MIWCLHGITQNANGSVNAMFLGRVPKNIYCGINKMELAVYDSVAVFNYGRQASLDIYNMVNVKRGQYTATARHSMNISQKYKCFVQNYGYLQKAKKSYSWR